jgi:hypothetical protein
VLYTIDDQQAQVTVLAAESNPCSPPPPPPPRRSPRSPLSIQRRTVRLSRQRPGPLPAPGTDSGTGGAAWGLGDVPGGSRTPRTPDSDHLSGHDPDEGVRPPIGRVAAVPLTEMPGRAVHPVQGDMRTLMPRPGHIREDQLEAQYPAVEPRPRYRHAGRRSSHFNHRGTAASTSGARAASCRTAPNRLFCAMRDLTGRAPTRAPIRRTGSLLRVLPDGPFDRVGVARRDRGGVARFNDKRVARGVASLRWVWWGWPKTVGALPPHPRPRREAEGEGGCS